MKVYLCGPINGCTDEEAKDWREAAKRDHAEFTYIDPMRNDYRGREAEPGIDEKIVTADKYDVYDSDVVLVNYDKPSVGTSMEILYGWEIGRAVVLVRKPGTVLSPWLTYHSHFICDSFAAAFKDVLPGLADGSIKLTRRGVPVPHVRS